MAALVLWGCALVLPDEDTFTIPASWRRMLRPRRGGAPGQALKVDREASWRLVAEIRSEVDDMLRTMEGEPDILREATAYLAGADATPRGAGVAAAVLRRILTTGEAWKRAGELTAFVDTWVTGHGLVFAVEAVVENERTGIGWKGSPRRPQYYLTYLKASVDVHGHGQAGPLLTRLRAHLAVAGETDHQAAIEALERRRADCHPLVAAFLFPGRADWVAEARAVASGSPPILFCALSSVDALRANRNDAWAVTRDSNTLPTLVEATGPAIAPFLARWFDTEGLTAGELRRLVNTLAVLPTDEAFELLLARLDRKYVQAAVLDAAQRFPVRATRLLARSGHDELLRAHVLGNRELLAEASLPDDVRAEVDRIVPAPDEDAGSLPELLVRPPWTRARVAAKPVVIDDLASDEETAVVWAPGERENWLATRARVSSRLTEAPWSDTVELYRTGRLAAYYEGDLFGAGPEDLVRPLLAGWRPENLWQVDEWLKAVVARYERDALPVALHVAHLNPAHVALLAPFADAEVAALMADCLRLKSARGVVLDWLRRHPGAAARHLVPRALAKPGKERRAAEDALRLLPPDEVLDAAGTHGDRAEAAVKAFLSTDPLEVLPARIPQVPVWAEPGLLPPVTPRDGGDALPATAAGHVVTMLAMSKPGAVYAGVDAVKELCTAASLAEFGWGLFQRWQKIGMPAKDGWALDALGWLGDDETVRRLTPLIRAWPAEGGHARAVHALDVLAEIGTEVALMHLHGISQKTKTRALRVRAQEKIAAVAATLSLTADQLGDRLVPHLGLDENGSLTLDYGPRQFVVGFDEGLRPYVLAAGGPRKDLPKPGASDDPELAAAARARFAALKKDVRTLAGDQVRRFEQAMVTGRRWTAAEFEKLFVAHPLLRHVVRRLVWADFAGGVTAFRVAEDSTLADSADSMFELSPSASVGVAHPLDLADTWAELFADYEIVQPFPQLGRPVYRLADGEDLTRFEGVTVVTGKIHGLTRRGWQRAVPQDNGVEPWLTRVLPGNVAVVLNLDPGITAGYVDEFPTQRIEHVWLSDTGEGDWAPRPGPPFGDLGRVSISEVLADLVELTG